MEAAVFLHELHKRNKEEDKVQNNVMDQFSIAATVMPQRYHARHLTKLFEGPSSGRILEGIIDAPDTSRRGQATRSFSEEADGLRRSGRVSLQ